MQPLFSGDKVKLLTEIMQRHTLAEMKKWQVGQCINISAAMQNITLNVITTTVFGITDPKQVRIFQQLAPAVLASYTPSLGLRLLRNKLWYPWRKFVNAREKLEQFLLQEISHVKQTEQTERTDILNALTTLSLSDTELCNYLKELLLSGYAAVHITLTWAIFYIYSRPEIHEKLLAELKSLGNFSIEEIYLSYLILMPFVRKY